jgi:hypothetical protein
VGGAVFKTVEAEDLGLGGSIPLRLRCVQVVGMAAAYTQKTYVASIRCWLSDRSP